MRGCVSLYILFYGGALSMKHSRVFQFMVVCFAFIFCFICVPEAFAENESIIIGSIWSQVGVAAPLGQAGSWKPTCCKVGK